MDILIQAAEISVKLRRAHKSLLSLFPEIFYERIEKNKEVIRMGMKAYKCGELETLMIILKDETVSAITQLWMMATACEMIEPSRPQ